MTTHPTSLSALLTDMQDQAKLAPLMPVSVRDRLQLALVRLEGRLRFETLNNFNTADALARIRAEVMPEETK